VWVGVWVARVRRGREPAAAGVALLAGAVGLRWALGWAEPHLPVGWFQPLREGFTPTHLREVTGDDLDVGLLRDKVWTWALAWPAPGWRAMMATDLFAGALTVMGVAEAGRRGLVDAPRRVALAVGVALSWGWWVASASELHAPVVGVYLLVGAWLHGVVVDVREGRGLRAAAWVGEIGCGFALVMLREELLAIAVATLAAGALHAAAPRLEPVWTRGWDAFWSRPRRALVVVAIGAAAWVALAWAVPMGALADPSLGKWTWLLRGLHPSSPIVPRLLAALLGLVAPGLVVAALIGSAGALRQPLRWAGLPLVMTGMFSAMWVAAHGGPEAWNLMRVSGW
jgi:hypothetical protein